MNFKKFSIEICSVTFAEMSLRAAFNHNLFRDPWRSLKEPTCYEHLSWFWVTESRWKSSAIFFNSQMLIAVFLEKNTSNWKITIFAFSHLSINTGIDQSKILFTFKHFFFSSTHNKNVILLPIYYFQLKQNNICPNYPTPIIECTYFAWFYYVMIRLMKLQTSA